MTDAGSEVRSFVASDGYPLHVRIWPASSPAARAGRGVARRSKPWGLVLRAGTHARRRGIYGVVSRSPRLRGQRSAIEATPRRRGG